jgi:hypothetical protein
MPVTRLAWVAVAACLAVQPLVHAQKGKGPKPEPVDTPGQAWLLPDNRWVDDPDDQTEAGKNVDWEIPDENACQNSAPGGIYGDGEPYFADGSGTAAFLRASDNDFVLDVRGTNLRVYVYFTDPASSPASPRKEFCAVALSEFHFHTHVLRFDGSDDINLGLLDIAPGATHPARILGNFEVGGIRYQYRFNAAHYPESSNVQITRGHANNPDLPGDNWWLIETGDAAFGSGEVVQLQSPALTKKGNPGPNDEGRYHFPFKILFTTDLSARHP